MPPDVSNAQQSGASWPPGVLSNASATTFATGHTHQCAAHAVLWPAYMPAKKPQLSKPKGCIMAETIRLAHRTAAAKAALYFTPLSAQLDMMLMA